MSDYLFIQQRYYARLYCKDWLQSKGNYARQHCDNLSHSLCIGLYDCIPEEYRKALH